MAGEHLSLLLVLWGERDQAADVPLLPIPSRAYVSTVRRAGSEGVTFAGSPLSPRLSLPRRRTTDAGSAAGGLVPPSAIRAGHQARPKPVVHGQRATYTSAL